jgi:poly-beta-1,6-N-acetyl-D-glucosamine synthase
MISFLEGIFWICSFIVFYSYFGYALLSYAMVKIRRKPLPVFDHSFAPDVSIVIAAYNEKDFIADKIQNTFELDYPPEKLKIIVVTDGSDDGTEHLIKDFPGVKHLHIPQRNGKIAAIDRAMSYVETPIVIFTDANTFINKDAVRKIIRHFKSDLVGGVAGEKRVQNKKSGGMIGTGEGLYWKYESFLKKLDSQLYSVVGAAGELYAIRKELYESVPKDTIIEDFYLTLKIAGRGYRIVYEPEAFSIESSSISVPEELKRKIRIAAGGIQSIIRLKNLLNPFKYKILSFQYISHRVLRWTLAPLSILLIFLSNYILGYLEIPFYRMIFILQAIFYIMATLGMFLENSRVRIKLFFIPFYFLIMNYAVYVGFLRHLKGSQSVLWEKAKREL